MEYPYPAPENVGIVFHFWVGLLQELTHSRSDGDDPQTVSSHYLRIIEELSPYILDLEQGEEAHFPSPLELAAQPQYLPLGGPNMTGALNQFNHAVLMSLLTPLLFRTRTGLFGMGPATPEMG